MFDKAINKVYNVVTKVRTFNMVIKGRNEYLNQDKKQTRYSVKPKRKARFTYKHKLALKAKRFRQKTSEALNLPVKRKVRKRKRLPSLKYILPLLISFFVVFGGALVLSFIRAEKTALTATEEKQPKLLIIHYGQKDYEVYITSGVVKDAIDKAGLELESEYEIIPSEYTDINKIDEAWVIKVENEIVEKIVETDFKIIENETESLGPNETKVLIEGEKGKKKIKLKLIYKNGILSSQIKLDEEIIRQPVDRVIDVGKFRTDSNSSD